jgi:Domain of unknown function (DUF4352)
MYSQPPGPGGPSQPPGQPWQPPGPYQPPQPPRGRRRGCLYAVLGVAGAVVLIIIAGIVAAAVSAGHGTASGASPPAPATSRATSTAPQLAGIGTPVRDGKFQFTITKITYAKTVGGQFGQTAQGEYTIVHVTVTNIGSVPQTLDDSAQYLYDAKGRKFSADSAADIFANGSSNSVFFNSINPGNTVHGKIAFDLPPGDKAVKAELHDSLFSGGVTVSLR